MKKLIKKLTSRTKSGVDRARALGVTVGKDCRLIDVTFSSEPYLVKIGNHVSATKTHFETHDGGIWIFRDKHPDWDLIKPIVIGNNVYIGSGVIILPGVTIGDNVIIGAGSVVTKSLEAENVYAGVPARKIKTINEYFEKIQSDVIFTKKMKKQDKMDFLLNKYK
ncbi:acyltransferase [Shewanella sp. A32]|uniref:acyltransferase n=1 Tax=Shewanella sp. A32 TaxID=3031327 RepID=UPI0023B99A16|nr:acyltransferase [Shewanella sp. A32]MDF0533016.1 acyltransferase [Shewanella sp. A32]